MTPELSTSINVTSAGDNYTSFPPATAFGACLIPLALIDESASNPRQRFDDLAELTASIKDHGVEHPIRVRQKGERYELIGGARRKRASEAAGLVEIPAYLEDVDDHEFLIRQLEDNANRKDPHPLEEALAYRRARNDGWSVEDLARRLGKPASTVYNVLKMTELIPEWQDLFFAREITTGHAMLLARLSAERQREALGNPEQDDPGIWDEDDWDNDWRKPEERKVLSVRRTAEWIQEHAGEDLKEAPFALDDAELLPQAGTCVACAKYSPEHRLCHDKGCFEAKCAAQVERKTREGLVAISDAYRPKDAPAGLILREEFVEIRAEEPELEESLEDSEDDDFDPEPPAPPQAVCTSFEEAVVAHGSRTGETMRICRDLNCSVHGSELKARQQQHSATDGRNPHAERREREYAEAEAKRKLELAARKVAFLRMVGNSENWDFQVTDDFAWMLIRHLTAGYLSVDLLRAVNESFGYLPKPKGKKAPKESPEAMKKALLKAAADWEGGGKRARLIVFLVLYGSMERGGWGGVDLLKEVASERGHEIPEILKELKAEAKRKEQEKAAKEAPAPKAKAAPKENGKKGKPARFLCVHDGCTRWTEIPPSPGQPALCDEHKDDGANHPERLGWAMSNEQGVYRESDCDCIDCPLKAPVSARLLAVKCADGWRSSFFFQIPDSGEGYLPNSENRAFPTKLQALAAAAEEMQRRAAYLSEYGSKEHRKAANALEKWAREFAAEAVTADAEQRSKEGERDPADNSEPANRVWPQADENGFFPEEDCLEIKCPVPGIEARLLAVECEDGFRSSLTAKLPDGSIGGFPLVKDKALPSEAEAIAKAARLMIAFAKAQEKREGVKLKKHRELAGKLKDWAQMILEDGKGAAA